MNLRRHSLMKKRLRPQPFACLLQPCRAKKTFADEEAIETYHHKLIKTWVGTKKTFADEEAIETEVPERGSLHAD